MADVKISALPAAATPLAGTEVLPVVQGGVTDKVSVANLTVGRDVGVKKLNATDNVVIGTAGRGIDFSANTHAAGMTSELLNDYEEGNWTPTVTPFSGTITSYTSSGTYTKIGNRVFFSLQVALTNNGTGAGVIDISLPYTVGAVSAGSGQNINSLWGLNGSIGAGGTIMRVARADGSYPGATGQTLRMFGSFIV